MFVSHNDIEFFRQYSCVTCVCTWPMAIYYLVAFSESTTIPVISLSVMESDESNAVDLEPKTVSRIRSFIQDL